MRKTKRQLTHRGIPEDVALIQDCLKYIDSPESFDPEGFALKLAHWIVNNARLPRLSGPEIAAMVDHQAVRVETISKAAEIVCEMLQGRRTCEAILQAHKRYGRTAHSLRDEYEYTQADYWAQKNADAEMSEEDRNELESVLANNRRRIDRYKAALAEYRRQKAELLMPKKDISGGNVLADG